MIELLGVGVPGDGGRWPLRGVSTRIERGVLTAVFTRRAAESSAFLDAVAGRLIPSEGRVWVNRRPLMRETAARVRASVADLGRPSSRAEHRSVFWNTLVGGGSSLRGLLRLLRPGTRTAARLALDRLDLADRAAHPMMMLSPAGRLRVGLASALASRAAAVVLREIDSAVAPHDVAAALDHARTLARTERIMVVASLASAARAREAADRVVVLSEGRLVFDGRAKELTEEVAP